MKFELLADKVNSDSVQIDDYVMIGDMLWHVINNFPVIGGGGRMLMLAFHTHTNPKGYKFHPSPTTDRFEIFRRID